MEISASISNGSRIKDYTGGSVFEVTDLKFALISLFVRRQPIEKPHTFLLCTFFANLHRIIALK